MNGFEPSFKLAVEAFNDVGGFGTGNFVPVSGIHVRSDFFCVLEDMIHDSNLHIVILMFRRTPPDAGFESVFPEHGNIENMFLDIVEEAYVVLVRAYPECFSDVLQEVYMADLYDDIREDVLCCLRNCRVVIASHRDKWVIHVLEFREELLPCFKTL